MVSERRMHVNIDEILNKTATVKQGRLDQWGVVDH